MKMRRTRSNPIHSADRIGRIALFLGAASVFAAATVHAAAGGRRTSTPTPTATAASRATATTSGHFSFNDPLSWAPITRRQLGCALEHRGHRDPTWNCTSKEGPAGDPCKQTEAYYAGPSFPDSLVASVSPLVARIDLHWEHGDLQEANLQLKPGVTTTAIEAAFHLAGAELNQPRPAVMSSSIQACAKNANCLVLQNFDHMGAGDVDCGGK